MKYFKFYVPYEPLYRFIAQRNHVDWERYKPAKGYKDAIRDLNSHFDEMQRTFNNIKKELKSNNLKNYFEVKDNFNFQFIKKEESQKCNYTLLDIEKEEKLFEKNAKKFNEIKEYFEKYEKHISPRISYDVRKIR